MTARQAATALVGGMLGGVAMVLIWCWLINQQLAQAEHLNGFGEG